MQAKIAIVVIAFNRPLSLKRLLQSLSTANYAGFQDIELIVSIDFSGEIDTRQVAEAFDWEFGEKEVIAHHESLGLKKHVLSCGDLSSRFDAVILLEDDLFVSPFFYDFAQQAYKYYKDDTTIAGIALYHQNLNETAYYPFEPIHDGSDVYFMQVPCSWGQIWTRKQWLQFKDFMSEEECPSFESLPKKIQEWPSDSSWKKFFYLYLQQKRKYFVYPRIGLCTNFGDAGQHICYSLPLFQTSLLISRKKFQFMEFQSSSSIYDSFYELEGSVYNKICQENISISFDLNGTKPLKHITTDYLVSSKKCSMPIKNFALSCYPYENNVLLKVEELSESQYFFSFGKTRHFSESRHFDRLQLDFQRMFLDDKFIRDPIKAQFEMSNDFRLGNLFLKPFRKLRSWI